MTVEPFDPFLRAAAPKPASAQSSYLSGRRKNRRQADVVLRLLDGIAIAASGWMGLSATLGPDSPLGQTIVVLTTIVALQLFTAFDADRIEPKVPVLIQVFRAALAWLVTIAIASTIVVLTRSAFPAYGTWLELWAGSGLVAVCLARIGVFAVLAQDARRTVQPERAFVVGTGPIAQQLLAHLADDELTDVVGVYSDGTDSHPRSCMGFPVRGSLDALVLDYREIMPDTVIVALPLSAEDRIARVMYELSVVPAQVRLCPDSYGLALGRFRVAHAAGLTFLHIADRPLSGARAAAKEIIDRLFAAFVLVALAPLFAVIAILIKLDSEGPVFFRQLRHGYNNRLIEVWKFRTLYHHAADHNAERLTGDGDPRVTRVGAFLRRSMLDELPQFINVLRGEMSVVGPRPHARAAKAGGILYRDAVRYYDARHRMKPGVTGWAQINGWRGETKTLEEIEQRVAHDLYYVENWSIALDVKIIAATFVMALRSLLPGAGQMKPHAMPLADSGRSRPAA